MAYDQRDSLINDNRLPSPQEIAAKEQGAVGRATPIFDSYQAIIKEQYRKQIVEITEIDEMLGKYFGPVHPIRTQLRDFIEKNRVHLESH